MANSNKFFWPLRFFLVGPKIAAEFDHDGTTSATFAVAGTVV
jgi:hypothetical protein